MISPKHSFCAVLLFTVASSCVHHQTFADRVATPTWPDFNQKVTSYTTLVDRLEKDLPPLGTKATAEQLVSHKVALAKAIRSARNTARQGDIFTRDLRKRFTNVIRSEMCGAAGRAAKNTVKEDNPSAKGVPVPLVVNATYPDAAPLSTVPPTLLLRLPTLPETVEYRFVGKALVLRDVRENTIVDYFPNAVM